MKTGVVVTGMGVVTSIGNSMEGFWQGLKDRTVGIGPITYFDITDYKCKLAAEVKGFDPKQYTDARAIRRTEAFFQFAVTASKETLEQSGISTEEGGPYRAGVCAGSDTGFLQAMEKDVKELSKKEPNHMNPLLVPLMINNTTAGSVAIQFGLERKCFNAIIARAAGTYLIGEAFRSIQHDKAGAMVADGAETNITSTSIAGFTSLIVLNTTKDASRASISFDGDRGGFVMDEGIGVVVLESLEHVKVRGVNILAEVAEYSTTCGAFHIISPVEDESGATRAMESAVKDADVAVENIDYVNVHGTSAYHDDLFETKAIRLALGDHAEKVKINSTRSMIGHLLGAVGGMEFITCVKSIQDGFVCATVGLEKPGESYDLDYTMGDGVSVNVDVAINNPLGFGGHNVSLIMKGFSE